MIDGIIEQESRSGDFDRVRTRAYGTRGEAADWAAVAELASSIIAAIPTSGSDPRSFGIDEFAGFSRPPPGGVSCPGRAPPTTVLEF